MSTIIKIYSDERAEMCLEDAGKSYQPCNGSEGEHFTGEWCATCARDKALSEGKPIEECEDHEVCRIVGLTMMCSSTKDRRYPKEWIYGDDGQPCCTAYIPVGEPIPAPVAIDVHTKDMFEVIS